MSRDPHKGIAPAGLVREGQLERPLRHLVRPRIEHPMERVQITQEGAMEWRWAPLRVKYATYEADIDALKVIVIGGRVALPAGAVDIADHIVQILTPATSTTYWIYLDTTLGTHEYSTTQPAAGHIEIATVTTPSTWPTIPTNWANHRPQVNFDSLHGLSPAVGDCVITLSDRTAYRWDGTAWAVLLQVADKRPWFSAPMTGGGGGGGGAGGLRFATLVVAASDSLDITRADYVCTGTNDDVTINTAIDALPAGGGKVVLLEGTYNCAGVMKLTDNLTLEGMGESTIIKGPTPSGVTVRWFRNQSTDNLTRYGGENIHIRHIRFDGNNVSTPENTCHAIGITADGTTAYLNTNITVIGCSFYNLGSSGIPVTLTQATIFAVRDCHADSCGRLSTVTTVMAGVFDKCSSNGYDTFAAAAYHGHGVAISAGVGVSVTNCRFTHQTGISVSGTSTDNRIESNYCEGSPGTSANIISDVSTCIRTSITNNVVVVNGFTGTGTSGILGRGQQLLVSGNNVQSNASGRTTGIRFNASATGSIIGNALKDCLNGIYLPGPTGCIVSANHVVGSYYVGIHLFGAIDCTISENTVRDASDVYGSIRLDDAAERCAVLNNTIRLGTGISENGIEIFYALDCFVNGNDCFQSGTVYGISDSASAATVLGYNRNNAGVYTQTPDFIGP